MPGITDRCPGTVPGRGEATCFAGRAPSSAPASEGERRRCGPLLRRLSGGRRGGDRLPAKPAGFSLIEVLVAAVLALGLILATAELALFSLWAKQKADTASGVAAVIAARIETLKGLPFDSAELAPGVHVEVVRDGPSRRSFDVEWSVEDAAAGSSLKRVRVAAAPVGRPKARAAITVFMSRDLGFVP